MEITISHIKESLKNLPPFQEKKIQDTYIGQKIEWELSLFDITDEKDSSNVLVHSNEVVNSGEYPSDVFFSLDINNYPELKIIKKKDRFVVSADIGSVKCGGNWIDLQNVTNLAMVNSINQNSKVNKNPRSVISGMYKNSFNNLHINNSQVNINGGASVNGAEKYHNKKSIFSMDNPLVYVLVSILIILITYYLSKYGIKS